MFVGRSDGRLTALDSANGMKLWEFQTGAGMNSPATSFEHDGKQYIVAYSAGNLFAGSARGDSLWLFGLEGALEPVPPAGSLMTFAPGAGGARQRRRRRDGLHDGLPRVPRRARRRRPRRRPDACRR